jgi:hypothetical protein
MAGRAFNPSLTEGQLNLPAGAQCKTPWGNLRSSQLASIARVTRDREIAFTSLYARLVLKGYVKVGNAELKQAERAIVSSRFGGSRAAYRAALARAGATTGLARGVIADEIRQARIERRFRVAAPAGSEISAYQSTYSERPARLVQVTPVQTWLGRQRRGVAIEGVAPAAAFRARAGKTVTYKVNGKPVQLRTLGPVAPLGAFSLGDARPAIRAALIRNAQDQVFDNWLMRQESSALQWTTCRRDWLPSAGTLELSTSLPFLALAN